MKQFAKQKEVVEKMQQGWEMYSDSTNIKGRMGQTVYQSRSYYIDNGKYGNKLKQLFVHHQTLQSLRKKGILNRYELTKLGKKIKL